MLEKPDIRDETIIACLCENYGLTVTALEFLPIGYDSNAGVYRASAADGNDYFLKAKKGGVDESSLAVPRFLKDAGIEQIVAPLPARDQRLWANADLFALILYPFIEGSMAMDAGMPDSQWIELGAVVRKMHSAQLPPDLTQRLQRETLVPKSTGLIAVLDTTIADNDFADPVQRALAVCWREQRAIILEIAERAEALGRSLRTRSFEYVLCHADLHTANILVDPAGRFFIVDWDGAMLSPKERDLMFATGVGPGSSVAYSKQAQGLFFRGYGATEIDTQALAYYRCDWVIQDMAEFAKSVFLTDDTGDQTRADAVRIFCGMFAPGESVEVAYQSI